jgi:membrane associated rhomboid family serine protease
MLPIRDLNPTRRTPYVTYGLIGLNVLAFIYEMMLPSSGLERFFMNWGVVPYQVTNAFSLPVALTFITSMFLHGGVAHIVGNMLYLWIFGDNVEDCLGSVLYTLFYFVSGILAGLAQVLVGPDLMIPSVGASGAVAGVLGAYLVMFPEAKVHTLLIFGFFVRRASIPAGIVLGGWFIMQFFNGVLSLGTMQVGGVAWFAHIGGFIFGLIAGWLCKKSRPQVDYTRWPRYPQRWQRW